MTCRSTILIGAQSMDSENMSIMPRLTWTSPFLSIAWLLLAVRAGVAQGSNPVRLAPPDGLLAIVVEGKYGFIDLEGRVIIPPAFDVAGQFSEGSPPPGSMDLRGSSIELASS
jgi:hypothetical protein